MNYALQGLKKYPLDSLSDIKRAETYFIDYEKDIPIEHRREFCQNLSKSQKEFSLPTHQKVAHYASDKLSKLGLNQSIRLREDYFEKKAEARQEIMDMMKVAKNIEGMVSKLISFDRKHHLDRLWDTKIPNPLLGILKAKKANQPEVYNTPAGNVTGDQIRSLKYHKKMLREQFTDKVVERFAADPIGTFKSMKDWEQDIIVCIATDAAVIS